MANHSVPLPLSGSNPLSVEQNRIDLWLDNVAHKGGAITGLAVLVSALILSFETLRHTASAYGYGPMLSILWPLLIDGIILSQSLVVLRRSRLGFSTSFNWFLLLIFELASLLINGAAGVVLGQTVTEQLIGAMVHGLPPLALFLVSKSMSNDIKDNGQLAGVRQTVADLIALSQSIEHDNRKMADFATEKEAEIATLTTKRESLQAEVKALQNERRKARNAVNGSVSPITGTSIQVANEGKIAQIEARRKQVLALKREGIRNSAIARTLGVSADTIRKDIKALNGQLAVAEGGE